MPNQPKKEKTNCVVCLKEFTTCSYNLRKGNGKYCSVDCRYASSRKKVNCSFCGKELTKRKSKKAKHFFCNNECKYNAAASLQHEYATGPEQKDKGVNTYRKRALRLLENKCSRCGYNEHKELLDVDHIDGNRQNNKIENLQILCVMCHAKKTRKPSLF